LWSAIGVERVRQYNHKLARDAAELLRNVWGVSDRQPLISTKLQSSMALIPLPTAQGSDNVSENSTEAKYIQDRLHYEYNIEVPIKCIQDRLYVRISAHIYNEITDYQKLANAVLQIRNISKEPTSTTTMSSHQNEKKTVRERALNLRLLAPTFAVCQLKNKEDPLPSWARNLIDKRGTEQGSGYFVSLARTQDELSIVCPENSIPDSGRDDLRIESNWRCFKVEVCVFFCIVTKKSRRRNKTERNKIRDHSTLD